MKQRMSKNRTASKILEIKDKKKEELEIDLKKQRDSINEERSKLSSLNKSFLEIKELVTEKQDGYMTNVYEMELYYNYIKELDKEIKLQKEKISKMVTEFDLKQIILVNLYKEIRLMEIYKEKKMRNIKREKTLSTQKEMDYLFISKWLKEHTLFFILFFFIANSLFLITPSFAEEDLVKFIKEKKDELIIKEQFLKKEEQRLKIIQEDIDNKIEKYNKILGQIENFLNKINDVNNERIKKVAKTYETMSPEDAAEKLSALDEEIAVDILSKMKSKKAGSVIAMMDTNKAVLITKSLANIGNKILLDK